MQIAVTGGSGVIGRAVIELGLAEGHRFVNIDRVPAPTGSAARGVPFVQTDITDYAAVENALRGCETLLHLAAIPRPFEHPDAVVHNTNVTGSYNALRAAVELGMKRVCQTSSANAIGHAFSRLARYDYFPLDESHPTYCEDPYSLSKWICEQQADAMARRYAEDGLSIASLRFHWVVEDRAVPGAIYAYPHAAASNLCGYTHLAAAARACLLALTAPLQGHEVFFAIAPDTAVDTPSMDLARSHFPGVPIRGDLSGNRSFFDSSKAQRLLGWSHRL